MVMHIESGVYVLQQSMGGSLLEVGRLFVNPGSPLVEHWFLYEAIPTPATGMPQRYAVYTTPSGDTPVVRITAALARDVTLWFSYVSAAPTSFDPVAYKATLSGQGLTATYVEATCTDLGTAAAAAPTSLPDARTQIDWGIFVLRSLSGYVVGYVSVTPLLDRSGSPVDVSTASVEDWYLYTTFPSTDTTAALYVAPGARNGGYRTKYEPAPTLSPAYSLQHIQAVCRIK